MLMHRQDVKTQADRSGLYLASTGLPASCQNPVCGGQAVVRDPSTGLWLCQACAEAMHDAKWGLGS